MAMWSFSLLGFLALPSRFHILNEPLKAVHEVVTEMDKTDNRSARNGSFERDRCSNNIRNINPTEEKDITMDLLHCENVPGNLKYFVYFNMWTRDNVNPPWVDILITFKPGTSDLPVNSIYLDTVPYQFKRIVPRSDHFLSLRFQQNHRNYSRIEVSASTDHKYEYVPNTVSKPEFLVTRWRKIYSIKTKHSGRIFVALPGVLRRITVTALEKKNIVLSFSWEKLNPVEISQTRLEFCNLKHIRDKFRIYRRFIGNIDAVCFAFKMPRFRYVLLKYVPQLYEEPGLYKWRHDHGLDRMKYICDYRPRRVDYKQSWISSFKLCERSGLSLPVFISRQDQEELLYLLKTYSRVFPIEAVFIGLLNVSGQVKNNCEKIYYQMTKCVSFEKQNRIGRIHTCKWRFANYL